ncbi:MAG: PKD domain-containing protein [Bacteroidia bacterium]
MMKKIAYITLVALIFAAIACTPYQDEDIDIGPLPGSPDFSAEVLPDDPNAVVIKGISPGFFSYVWDLPGGAPGRSTQPIDTIVYTKAGTYTITLYAASETGGGTSSVSKTVTIDKDLVIACDSLVSLLTGECQGVGKKWTFSKDAGAVAVGPNPYSTEWYSSPPNGLQPAQYDDVYSFFFDGSVFEYDNNGTTVDPCQGYQALPFTAPANMQWSLTPGAGVSGETRITLPDEIFMGVMDSGPYYDIISVTENELVLHGPLKPCSPGATGWFTLRFVKAD